MIPGVVAVDKKLRFRSDLALLMASVLWGTGFVAQRLAAAHLSAYLFNGLRFLLGALLLAPFVKWKDFKLDRHTLGALVLVGFFLFSGAAFQQEGLRYTTASNAGFITGLYVVFTPVLIALVWRKWPRSATWLASALAASGLFLLSTGGQFRLAPGDGLELVGAIIWALHVILVGWLVHRLDVLQFAVLQFAICGMMNIAALILMGGSFSQGMDVAWWTVIYSGIVSVALGFTLQAVGQRVAPPSDAAILLSMEAVFAALFGAIFLSERLSLLQYLGCVLMFSGMLLAQFYEIKK